MARILVVDDEPGMRKSLAIMLRRDGHQVTETASVAEAIGRLKGEAYQLVIADLMMEPLSGLDLLSLVREHRPDCPVIIVTAFGSPESRRQAIGRGATAFLEKPIPVTEMLDHVRTALGSADP